MLLITFVELRVVAGRNRTWEGRSHAFSERQMVIHTCHAILMPRSPVALISHFLNGMVVAWHGRDMACVNQTLPHCVNQMGKTQSKHFRGTAWARHGNGMVCVNCPSAACLRDLYLTAHNTYKRHASRCKPKLQTAWQLGSLLHFCCELNAMNSQWICCLPNHLCLLDTLRMYIYSHFMISLKIVTLFVANWPHRLAVWSVIRIVLDYIRAKYDSHSHYFPRQSQMKVLTNLE
jgi:hypothetical protein